jgi:cysteinyl-tRNA synthetase
MVKQHNLHIYNTLTRKKEKFEPVVKGAVGMYVCGPTVYGDPHLGHARSAIVFDLVFRYLKHLGYKVRYVRNITDVGHLEHDADEGEDKIAKKARLEQLEPMEVAQYYTNRYRIKPNILSNGHKKPPHKSGAMDPAFPDTLASDLKILRLETTVVASDMVQAASSIFSGMT